MPLNKLPQGVSSNLDAGLLGGLNSSTWASSTRAGYSIHGGGTVSVSATGSVSWSSRFIVISVGRGTFFSTAGYYDINMPPLNTIIPGFGGSSGTTVTSEGISVPAWQNLYYELPLGSSNTSVAENFRLVSYTVSFDIPPHWIPICRVNGDNAVYYFPNGMNLTANFSASSGPVGPLYLSTTTPIESSYTLVLTDNARLVEMNFATANTLTIPLNSSAAFPTGTQILIVQVGAGQTTISPTGGVTLNGTPGLKLRAQWSSATLIKRSTNTWLAIGDLAA